QLFTLGQRLRAGQHVVASLVPFVAERTDRDGGDVPLVDRRGPGGAMEPAHHIAMRELRSPPVAAVERERARPEKRPRHPRLLDRGLDARVNGPEWIRLLGEPVARVNGGPHDDY